MAQTGIRGRLQQTALLLGVPRVVRYQVEVLFVRSGDAEGLLRKSVCLVCVPAHLAAAVLILVAPPAGVGGFAGTSPASAEAVPSLTLHLSVGQKATGDATSTPRLPVSPAPHACLPLVPDKYRAMADSLPLLLR